MKKIIISLTTILAFQVNAQMKIGNNVKTLNSNANLQVEAISGDQVIITRDSGKVGIGTLSPVVKLDVIGTVKITDGTQGTGKVLVSDANGQASWKNASTIQAASTDSTSASNGLTLSGKDVQLGGTLSKATTITTSVANTIALAGLQSGASSDSILVVNPSTGVIRRLSPSVLGSATEPWYSTTTSKGATLNTENIYQMGKVGINFNNPTEQFEVNGNIYQRGYSYFKKNTGNTSAYIWTDFTSAGDAINYSFNYHNVASADTVFNSGYGTNTFSQRNAGFYFNTSNGVNGASPSTNVMVITNAGRVGINTSNPSAKLHVIDTTNNTPLRLEGLASGSITSDSVLVATSTGVVKKVSLTSAVDNSVGAISIFPYSAIPSGYLECNGQAISRTTYSDLFAKIGTTYGTGNGSTTFNLPDLRGEFVRGWDNGRGVDNGRAIGSKQNGTAIWANGLNGFGSGYGTNNAVNDLKVDNYTSDWTGGSLQYFAYSTPSQFVSETLPRGIARPRNVAMVYAMKVTPSLNFTSGGSSSTTEPWYSTTTNTGATSNSENVYQMGKVGIGTSNPTYQLDVQTNSSASTLNAQFVNVNQTSSAESQVGIGAGPGSWAKIVGYNDAIGFRNYTTGKENLTIRNGSGNIGIGTNNPICALHVEPTASVSYNLPNRQFIYGPSYGGTVVQNAGAQTQSLQVAAYFGNRIQVNGFIESQAGALTLSDLRAKNIIGISNNEKDLNTLSKIQITDYKLKDIHLGQNEQKKVIAQQLDTVYPQAVITQNTPKLMPTVYDYPKEVSLVGNNIKLILKSKVDGIKKGDKLAVRFKDKEYQLEVIQSNKNEIELIKDEDLVKRKDFKELFVYGTFVNDAKSVDYEAISMLNVSATQAVIKKVKLLEAENQELYKKIEALEKQNEQLQKIQSGFETLKAEIQNLKKDLYKEVSLK